jgi:acyl dehydratase
MKKIIFHHQDELLNQVGQELAVSDWLLIDQNRISTFADCTIDHQWIHIDVERAKKESVYGNTIAHGFLTLSLVPYFLENCFDYHFAKSAINYGLNKVRFPNAVTVGSRIRARFRVVELKIIEGGIQIEWGIQIDIEGVEKPACVADMLIRLYF